MTQHYYTADLHLCHEKVAKIRGFSSTREHDEAVLKGLKEVAHSGNQIFILGDISGGKHESDAIDQLALATTSKNVDLHLVAGNHDSVHPMHRKYTKSRMWEVPSYLFSTTDTMGTFRHNKDKVMLSHFPYTGDRGEDRYPEYRLKDTGKPIVHGHTHSSERVSYSDKGSLQICVSLDAWGLKPVPKHELVKLIESQTS